VKKEKRSVETQRAWEGSHGVHVHSHVMRFRLSASESNKSSMEPFQKLTQNHSAVERDDLSELLPPIRLCKVKTGRLNEPRKRINEPIGVPYQCAGPSYEYFSKRLMKLVSNPKTYGKNTTLWGRRSLPLPPNGTIMFFGNSHTRQVFQSLMCQYQEKIISATPLSQVDSKGNGVWEVRLQQNVTVFGVFNVHHVYSPRWVNLIEVTLNRSLDSFNVIVLGKFNGFQDSKGTSFAKLMKTLTAGTDADFERSRPPDVDALANVYSGPILAVSMFADHDVERTQDILRKVTTIQESGRDNIVFINGRAYVPEIGECATDKSDTVGTCSKDFRTAKNRGKNGHRCVGENGGHPDLVAWDVVEECYRLMSYD
jgi:hypothetical protein